MSREFGDHAGGYFHHRLRTCAEDCAEGRDPLTHKVGALLEALQPIAYAISSSEANDWSPGRAIAVALEKIGPVTSAMHELHAFLEPYNVVARKAAQDALDEMARKATGADDE